MIAMIAQQYEYYRDLIYDMKRILKRNKVKSANKLPESERKLYNRLSRRCNQIEASLLRELIS